MNAKTTKIVANTNKNAIVRTLVRRGMTTLAEAATLVQVPYSQAYAAVRCWSQDEAPKAEVERYFALVLGMPVNVIADLLWTPRSAVVAAIR